MKNLIGFIFAALLIACSPSQLAVKTSVDSVTVGGNQTCASGTLAITANTAALRDSLLNAAKNDVFQINHVLDTGYTSLYKWNICSPKQK